MKPIFFGALFVAALAFFGWSLFGPIEQDTEPTPPDPIVATCGYGLAGLLAFGVVGGLVTFPFRLNMEKRRVAKYNEAIQHDQAMNAFTKHHRYNWSSPAVQAEYRAMQQTQARLRDELEQLGGHESL